MRYAERAVKDEQGDKFGKWVRLAAKRFLDDLWRAKKRGAPFHFETWHANDACDFIEKLPHVEGKWATPTLKLHQAHVFFVVNLFGFRNADGTRRFSSALLAIARKNAKALSLDTPVPTPSGWSTMGELEPGDLVFGADGKPCRVVATSPVFTHHECYRLTFSNDESVVADAGHLWVTRARVDRVGSKRKADGKRTRVRTTRDIAATLRHGARGDWNHRLSMPGPIHGPQTSLPVPPYTLGAWLGDGHTHCARLTCDRSDAEILDGIRADGLAVRDLGYHRGRATTYALNSGRGDGALVRALRAAGVLDAKHIPPAYLRVSVAQRIALLQGLMDTDGTAAKSGRVLSYTSASERLARNVGDLLATLGVKYSITPRAMRCNGRPVPGKAWLVQFVAFRDELTVFRLRRKLTRMRARGDCEIAPRSRTVQIVGAERVASVPVKCISVDAPDRQFLFGRTMLPTHNSTLAAAILLYCLCCEHEPGAQVLAAATTGDQARKVFDPAKRMVERTPDLREAFQLEPFANSIACWQIGGSFKPINAKASTQDGLNPSHTALDEIHAHKTHDLLNVLRSAAGARNNALWLYTTTEGYETPGPWPELRHFAKQILIGATVAEHFFALIFALDDEEGEKGEPGYRPADDDFDESKWPKANPLIEVNPVLLAEIRKEAIEAKSMPGKLAEFRIKRLNRQSSTAKGAVRFSNWKACGKPVDLKWLEQYPCWGGLDLASTTDLCSFRLLWRVEGIYYTWGRRWVPEHAVKQRTQRATVPYAGWVASGYLEQTPGEVTDHDAVEKAILDAKSRFKIISIGYDDWNAKQLVAKLKATDLTMVQVIQGPKTYHPACQEFERSYIAGLLHHANDPVLTWCASNLVWRYDANLNMAPDKKKAPDKIDDMSALLMAYVPAAHAEPEKKYQFFTL